MAEGQKAEGAMAGTESKDAVIAVVRTIWFHFRVLRDERGLRERFGEPYVAYTRCVKRWLPGLF